MGSYPKSVTAVTQIVGLLFPLLNFRLLGGIRG